MKNKVCFWIGNCVYILLAIATVISYGLLDTQDGGFLDKDALFLYVFLLSFCLHLGFYWNEMQGKFKTLLLLTVVYLAGTAGIISLRASLYKIDLATEIIVGVAIVLGFYLSFMKLDFLGCTRYAFTPILSWVIGTIGFVIFVVCFLCGALGAAEKGARKENCITRSAKRMQAEYEEERKRKIENGEIFFDCLGHEHQYKKEFYYNGKWIQEGDTYVNRRGEKKIYGYDDKGQMDV